MLLDSCSINPDGAVRHAYLYFVMFLHSRLLFVKVFTLCGVILRTDNSLVQAFLLSDMHAIAAF